VVTDIKGRIPLRTLVNMLFNTFIFFFSFYAFLIYNFILFSFIFNIIKLII
jgi:hypothetical protein